MKTPEEMALKTFTIDDIRSWKPCYDPSKHLPENWTGTAIDILKHESIPSKDKLWVVCKEKVLNEKTLRIFAVWCARQVEHLMTDERSKAALIVAEKFTHGEATRVELEAAEAAAWDAWDVAEDAARDAAWAAAWAADGDVWDAAENAPAAAAGAAVWAVAKDAARNAQVAQLLKMLEGV